MADEAMLDRRVDVILAIPAGFERPFQPPRYMHYDMAQFLMWRIVGDLLNEGAFAGLLLRPQQIVSQILDTLNRAAFNRLSLQEAAQRQLQSMAGDAENSRHAVTATVQRLARDTTTEQDLRDNFATLTLGSGAAAMVLFGEILDGRAAEQADSGPFPGYSTVAIEKLLEYNPDIVFTTTPGPAGGSCCSPRASTWRR